MLNDEGNYYKMCYYRYDTKSKGIIDPITITVSDAFLINEKSTKF